MQNHRRRIGRLSTRVENWANHLAPIVRQPSCMRSRIIVQSVRMELWLVYRLWHRGRHFYEWTGGRVWVVWRRVASQEME